MLHQKIYARVPDATVILIGVIVAWKEDYAENQ